MMTDEEFGRQIVEKLGLEGWVGTLKFPYVGSVVRELLAQEAAESKPRKATEEEIDSLCKAIDARFSQLSSWWREETRTKVRIILDEIAKMGMPATPPALPDDEAWFSMRDNLDALKQAMIEEPIGHYEATVDSNARAALRWMREREKEKP